MNVKRDCQSARAAIFAGESSRARDHMVVCAACRREAARTDRLLAALRETAEVRPSRALDAAVLRSLRARARRRTARLRPIPAILMAATALASLVVLLCGVAALTPVGDAAPLVAIVCTGVYLALSAVATAPILLLARRQRGLVIMESTA